MTHHLFCCCWLKAYKSKKYSCFAFTPHLIVQACINAALLTPPAQTFLLQGGLFVYVRGCRQLNRKQIGSSCLTHADVHYQLSKRVTDQRGE